MHRSSPSLLAMMPTRRRGTLLAGWLFGVLALLLVLTQQGGQAHALAHELSFAAGQSAAALSERTGVVTGVATSVARGVATGWDTDRLAGQSADRDAGNSVDSVDTVDAVCVLCVGFANTLATTSIPAPGVLPLLVLGELRPAVDVVLQPLTLLVGQPIRGPPAAFSFPR